MKLYISNISYEATDADLRELFGSYGEITSLKIITDRQTGKPKGFAFLEYDNDVSAVKALYDLDGVELKGRKIAVKEAV